MALLLGAVVPLSALPADAVAAGQNTVADAGIVAAPAPRAEFVHPSTPPADLPARYAEAPSQTAEDEPAGPAKAKPAALGRSRTAYSETERRADGSATTRIFRNPAFRRDTGGAWIEVDHTLRNVQDPAYPVQAPGAARPIRLGAAASRLISVDLADGPVTFTAPGLDVTAPTLHKDGTATYQNVAPQTDLVYTSSPAGLKEEIVLRGPDAPSTYKFRILDARGQLGAAERQPDGSYIFTGAAAPGVHLGLGAARAYAKPRRGEVPDAGYGTASLSVRQSEGGFDVDVSVDSEWRAKQRYPVILDPTVTFGPANGAVTDVDFPTSPTSCGGPCGVNQDGFLRVGWFGEIWRSALRFDLSSVPRGSTVSSANYHHILFGCSALECPTENLEIRRIDGPWTTASSGPDIAAATGSTVLASAPNATADYNLTAQTQRWVSRTDPNNGISLQLAGEAAATLGAGYYSSRGPGTSDELPQLTVNYNPPPMPTVTKAAAPASGSTGPGGVYARGQAIRYTVSIGNSGAQAQPATLADDLPDGMQIDQSSIRIAGLTCAAAQVACLLTPAGDLSISDINLPATSTTTITYDALVSGGSERSCAQLTNSATVVANAGTTAAATAPVTVCDAGLGLEAWWTTTDQATGPQGTAAVNVANGNLVLEQVDTTPVQARGRLAHVLRRTYNSQDSTALTLPGSIGAGWLFNLGEAGEAAGDGLSGTGLRVPTLNSLTNPLAVTLLDRDGTRHAFDPKSVAVNLPLAGADAAVPAALQTLVPRTLTVPTGYTNVCLDVSYTAPQGVHLGLFRYVAVDATTSAPCSKRAGSPNATVILGYASVRPDRFRNEYDAAGRLVSQADGAGAELRYTYATVSGVAVLERIFEPNDCSAVTYTTGCRATAFDWTVANQLTILDPAQRATVYRFDGPITSATRRLLSVTNPDQTVVAYTYNGVAGTSCTGAAAGQICSVSDLRTDPIPAGMPGAGHTTTFTYAAAPAGLPRISTVTDRRGNTAAYAYSTDQATTTVTRSGAASGMPNQIRSYRFIDNRGRTGELQEADSTGALFRKTLWHWDTAGATCRRPDNQPDNNLCEVQRLQTSTAAGAAPTQTTSYTYNPDGMPLITSAVNGTARDVQTDGYRVQYVSSGGTAAVFNDAVTGGGQVSVPDRGTVPATSLYTIDDHVTSVPARGNAATNWPDFATAWIVDNTSGAPNASPSTGTCNADGTTTGNTGLVCETQNPSSSPAAATTPTPGGQGAAAKRDRSRSTYDRFGQKLTSTTPKALECLCAQPQQYSYLYYGGGERDLSGRTSTSGWLKAVTDPNGSFVAYGHDAAGNTARTWDRNATARATDPATGQPYPPTAYPSRTTATATDRLTSAPSPAHTEVLYAPTTAYATSDVSTALANPWRYPRSTRDPLGNLARITTDNNGNVTVSRPPRGTSAGTDRHDRLTTYDPDDLLSRTLTPADAQRVNGITDWPTVFTYDTFGNLTATTDPRGFTRTTTYDGVNRAVTTSWTRGPWPAGTADTATVPDCAPGRKTTTADAPLPADRILCQSATGWDGLNQNTFSQDAAGAVSTMSYDSRGRMTSMLQPRNDGTLTTLRTDSVYDAGGLRLRVCPPREFAEGSGACGAAARYSTHNAYDPAGRLTQQTGYRQALDADGDIASPAAWETLTTGFGYDADGNTVSTTNPNGATTQFSYDLLGRKSTETSPRDPANNITRWTYDPVGNTTAVTRPGSPARITANTYDANNRPVDTVTGATTVDANAPNVAASDGGSNNRRRTYYDADGNVVAQLDPRHFTTAASITTAVPTTAAFLSRTDYDENGRPTAQYLPRFGTGATDPGLGSTAQATQCSTTGPMPSAISGVPAYAAGTGVCRSTIGYDPAGNAIKTVMATSNGTDNRNHTFAFSDDNLPIGQDSPNPAGATATAPNCASGTLAPGRVRTCTRFDGARRPVSHTDALGHTNITVYNADGTVARTESHPNGPLTHVVRTTYDASGLKTSSTDATNKTSRWRYLSDGSLHEDVNPNGDTTRYGRDAVGNATRMWSGSAVEANDARRAGRAASDTTNQAGLPTVNSYLPDNLLERSLKPYLVPTANAADATLRRTDYSYDTGGRTTAERTGEVTQATPGVFNPARDGGTITFGYYPNDLRRVETGRDGAAQRTTTYDAAGNPTQITDGTNTAAVITAGYYLDGRARSVSDGTRTTTYAYDGAGMRTARNDSDSTWGIAMTYSYNDASLPIRMTSTAITGAYDLQYDAAGRSRQMTDPSGVRTDFVHNDDDSLASTTTTTASGTLLASWAYTYDAQMRLLTQDFTGTAAPAPLPPVPGQGGVANGRHAYTYDDTGRLASFTSPGTPTKAISYDRNGNRLAYGPQRFVYNADGSVSTQTNPDGTGSQTSAYNPWGGLTSDGCTTHTYDAFDRTATAAAAPTPLAGCAISTTNSVYKYDGLDRQRSHTSSSRALPNDVTETHYDGFGRNVSAEVARNQATMYALDSSGVARALTQGSTASSAQFLNSNGQDDNTLVTTTTGAAACTARFDPYGTPVGAAGDSACNTGSTKNDLFYRGARRDQGTGHYQLGGRTYDPNRASFSTPDGLRGAASGDTVGLATDPLTANSYSYVNGDPVNYIDPTGHFRCMPEDRNVGCYERHESAEDGAKRARAHQQRQAYNASDSGKARLAQIDAERDRQNAINAAERQARAAAESEAQKRRKCKFGVCVTVPFEIDMSTLVHGALDVVGALPIPVVSSAASGANALMYLAEGDKVNFSIAAAAAAAGVVGAGGAVIAAKIAMKGGKIGAGLARAGSPARSTVGAARGRSGQELTSAAEAGAKRGPKPFGTGPHNIKIGEVADSVTDGQIVAGGQTNLRERLIPTPGGFKSGRRPDILVQRPDGSRYGINVGQQSPRTGAPIRREAEAIDDLEGAGLEMHFVPYN